MIWLRYLFVCLVLVSAGYSFGDTTITPDQMPPISVKDVEVALSGSQASSIAGAKLAIFAEIKNRSTKPIWIVAVHSRLLLPPEMWGNFSSGDLWHTASLPTVSTGNLVADTAKIDPGSSYTISWIHDPWESAEASPLNLNPFGLFSRFFDTFTSFLLFSPGSYDVTALVQVWSDRPAFPPDIEAAQLVQASMKVNITLPMSILIAGSITGGLLAFILKLLTHIQSKRKFSGIRYIIIGIPLAIVVCAVGAILVQRLSEGTSMLSITVHDYWGAVTLGFLIEWFGIEWLMERVGFSGAAEKGKAEENTSNKL